MYIEKVGGFRAGPHPGGAFANKARTRPVSRMRREYLKRALSLRRYNLYGVWRERHANLFIVSILMRSFFKLNIHRRVGDAAELFIRTKSHYFLYGPRPMSNEREGRSGNFIFLLLGGLLDIVFDVFVLLEVRVCLVVIVEVG